MTCKLRQAEILCSAVSVEHIAPSNIIPHQWYKEITTNSGAPDGTAISVLSEIVYQNRFFRDSSKKFNRGGWWITSYSHFEHKLNYRHSSVKGALERLVKRGILETRLDLVKLQNGAFVKRLFIRLSDDFFDRYNFNGGRCDVIPHALFHEVTNGYGSPDFAAIVLLSEAIYWHRPTIGEGGQKVSKFKGSRWQTSYAYLEKKFGYGHERIRTVFVKLEKMKKIRRTFSEVTSYGQVYSSRLFIELSEDYADVSDQIKFQEGGTENVSIRYKEKTKKENLSNRSMIYKNDFFDSSKTSSYSDVMGKRGFQGLEHDLIDHNDQVSRRRKLEVKNFSEVSAITEEEGRELRKKTRRQISVSAMNRVVEEMSKKLPNLIFLHRRWFLNYMLKALSSELRSDEYLNSLVENPQVDDGKNREMPVSSAVKKTSFRDIGAISESECEDLQCKSGRSFSLNAMNEIMEDMAKRHPDKTFLHREAFLSYMSEVLRHEKRKESEVNYDTFRIKGNMSEDEVNRQEREKYLSMIEYSLDMSESSRLKKKLIPCFSPDRAYEILRSYAYSFVKEGVFYMSLVKDIMLSESERLLILDKAMDIYEFDELHEKIYIGSLKILLKGEGGEKWKELYA